jgi:PKHD-type hydroxylase
MILNHFSWKYTEGVPIRNCDEIILYANTKKEEERLALTGIETDKKIESINDLNAEEIKDLKKRRISNVIWLDEKWIYKLIQPFVNDANKNAGWNFQWDFSETCQYTTYEVGQFYDWHMDGFSNPYKKEGKLFNKIRKLSVTLVLSDPSEYEGGMLEFYESNVSPKQKPKIILEEERPHKGSVIVFPAHIYHRVTPVTKGVRKSLVVWNCGYPYK